MSLEEFHVCSLMEVTWQLVINGAVAKGQSSAGG